MQGREIVFAAKKSGGSIAVRGAGTGNARGADRDGLYRAQRRYGALFSQGVSEKFPETPSRRLFRHFCVGKPGTIPYNIAQRLTDAFTPSAACSFLDVPPVRLRNLQFASDANPSRHPSRELCGIAPDLAPLNLRFPSLN